MKLIFSALSTLIIISTSLAANARGLPTKMEVLLNPAGPRTLIELTPLYLSDFTELKGTCTADYLGNEVTLARDNVTLKIGDETYKTDGLSLLFMESCEGWPVLSEEKLNHVWLTFVHTEFSRMRVFLEMNLKSGEIQLGYSGIHSLPGKALEYAK